MNKPFAAVLAAMSLAFAALPASATDSMSKSMMMPTCASGDPVVGVNTNTKMYLTHDQMKMKSAGMTAMQKQAMMEKNHVKLMCKSKAEAMGAKPMKSAM
jgi:hypothetical protein